MMNLIKKKNHKIIFIIYHIASIRHGFGHA